MAAGKRQTVWSANAWTVTYGRVAVDSGKGTDEFLKIEQPADDFSHTAGLDGEGAFNKLEDDYTTVTITLLQTSALNQLLWAALEASKVAEGLLVPLFVADRKGVSKLVATDSVILKKPDETVGKEAGNNTWVIGCSPDVRVVGGH